METLRVGAGSAPPFSDDGAGLDVDLMTALAERLGATVEFVHYAGADFEGVFDGLGTDVDCLAAGVTVTPPREKRAVFLPPYVITGQALALDTGRLPSVRSLDDLAGLTVGIQQGTTSRPIADQLVADGKAAAVRVYDYGSARAAMSDLTSGACDAFLALAPVLAHVTREAVGVEVVQRGLGTEHIAVAVAPGDQALLGRLTVAQAELEADGTLQEIRRKWLGNPYADQSLAVH